jgi:hypothetical protein
MTRPWILYHVVVAVIFVGYFALFEPEYVWAAMLGILVLLSVDYFIYSRLQ